MFQPRIESAVRALGLKPSVVAGDFFSPDDVPALVVLDLHEASGDALRSIGAAKAAGARVLAFGRHTDLAVLRAARGAGADRVVPRSQFVEELPRLIADLVSLPTLAPEE